MAEEKAQQDSKSTDLVCRTCLATSPSYQSIFDTSLDKVIMNCASVKVFKGDGLPSQICLNCVILLNQAHTFKRQAENSERALRELYCHVSVGKETNADAKKESSEDNRKKSIKTKGSKNKFPRFEKISESDCVKSVKEVSKKNLKKNKTIQYLENKDNVTDHLNDTVIKERSSVFNKRKDAEHKYSSCLTTDTKNVLKGCKSTDKVSKKPHKCCLCTKLFSTKKNLLIHMKKQHKGQLQCNTCQECFLNQDSLNRHILLHKDGKNFKCEICSNTFPYYHSLIIHQRIHTKKKPVHMQSSADVKSSLFKV